MKLQELIDELQKVLLKHPESNVEFGYYTSKDHVGWRTTKMAFADVRERGASHLEVRFAEPCHLPGFMEVKDDPRL